MAKDSHKSLRVPNIPDLISTSVLTQSAPGTLAFQMFPSVLKQDRYSLAPGILH